MIIGTCSPMVIFVNVTPKIRTVNVRCRKKAKELWVSRRWYLENFKTSLSSVLKSLYRLLPMVIRASRSSIPLAFRKMWLTWGGPSVLGMSLENRGPLSQQISIPAQRPWVLACASNFATLYTGNSDFSLKLEQLRASCKPIRMF